MRILDPDQTAAALPWDRLVPAIENAARELAAGAIDAPERLVVPLDAHGVLLCMPAIGKDIGVTKLITVHADNAHHGLPAIQGEVTVFDRETGRRLALLDGPTVTARRTAAVTLLGIRLLAPRIPQSVILIGSGTQAGAHADALIDYFGVRDFHVVSRDARHAQALCNRIETRSADATAQPLDAAGLAARPPEADLLIAATTSRMPVIPANLPPHMLAVGVGAFKPDMAEFPAELLHARSIVVDHLAGARHEAGDLLRAQVDWSHVRELASVATEGFRHNGALPLFKTVGHAAWDLAASRVALSAI
jgi:1-piperideine-2-carboxylate/1-pyrroline-2-carboxylate reductase [NAD(P)H]